MSIKRDKLGIFDELRFEESGSIIMQSHAKRIIGEVTILELDSKGNVLFSNTEKNDVILTGSTYVLEKIFAKRSTIGITTLSQDMGINAAVLPTVQNLKDEYIFGFMVGIGGSEDTAYGSVKSVKYTDKNLASAVPFRASTNALSPEEEEKYFMKKVQTIGSSPVNCYWAKKFSNSTPVTIKHLYTDGTEVQSNISETGSEKGIKVFSEMICDISALEIREYFNLVYGEISNCRVNTLGLVAGFYDNVTAEIAGVRLITTVNFISRPLNNDENIMRLIYRLYCV